MCSIMRAAYATAGAPASPSDERDAGSNPRRRRRNRRRITGGATMKPRVDIGAVSATAYRAMLGLEKFIHESSIEPQLAHLLKMRASQINGCAYCLDMHSKDARAGGETEQRLYGLDAWREAP